MLRLIMILIGLTASAFTMAMAIRYGLKGAFAWDEMICNKRNAIFRGFRRHFRMPSAIGVIPEFFYFLVLGGSNYFTARWWALRTASYLSFLIFIAALFSRTAVQNYYSLSYMQENGIGILFTSGSSFWYLNIVTGLFLLLFVFIIIESIRMHGWWSPVRILFYSILSLLMSLISLSVLILIIALTILYTCYKIIRWFMSSRRRVKVEDDDDNDTREKLNNTYRSFRAELYEWEKERKLSRPVRKEVRKKPIIKRSRKKTEAEPSNNDFPRFHPD